MKTSGLVVFFLALTALGSAATPLDSHITAATVYTDRAVVTRRAYVDLASGEQELLFERLPAHLVDNSLQVSGRGTASATILDVSARTIHVDATPSMRVKALEDEVAGLRWQDRGLADKLKLNEQQRTLLGRIEASVTAPPAEGAAARPSFEEWQRLLLFQSEQLTRLAAEQQALDHQREELAAKIAAMEAQLNELRSRQPAGRSYKTVTVRVAGSAPGRLEVSLSYAVPGANWTPAYDVRLRSAERAVELTYFGVVRNATGEDWSQIALTLSTARPGLGGAAPEPAPWVVDVERPRPMALPAPAALAFGGEKGSRGLDSFNASVAAPGGDALMGKTVNYYATGMATAAVDASATSATFKIAAPATLPSDASTQKVAITSTTLPARLQYQATPKQLESAFLSAYVANASDFPLLAGAANTFLDDTFVAASRLKTVMPGETFELALGADEGIAIKRKLVKRFTEDTGLTGKGRRVSYEWLVTVTNHKPTAERVVFKEPAPVSRDEKIVVKQLAPAERDVGTAATPKEVTREADGMLVWRVDLNPGEKREFPVKFTIEHPADLAVTGVE